MSTTYKTVVALILFMGAREFARLGLEDEQITDFFNGVMDATDELEV